MRRLDGVTLLCADTRAPALALRAMAKSMETIAFARALLLTRAGARLDLPAGVERIDIAPIATRDAYSQLMLKGLAPFVSTAHALVVQWDGYVVNADAWTDAFLDCDYIGAPWSWQPPGRRVGNGGFSLRSRRLIDALADEHVRLAGNEDETIGVAYRPWLEVERGIRFADEPLAHRFSFEAAHPIGRPFGFHGLFNFARVVPDPELAALARGFDDEVARSPQCLALMRNAEALGRWSAVDAIAGRIAAADPTRAEARSALARAREAQARGAGVGRNEPCPCGSGKRYKACHGALTATAAAAPNAGATIAEDLVRQGMAAHARGDVQGARRAYDAALAQVPDHPHASHYLGVLALQSGATQEAIAALEAVAFAQPEEPDFHGNLGLAYASVDRLDEAIAAQRRALALAPAHAGAWNNLGLALQESGRRDEAVGAFDAALRCDPGLARARWNRAMARLARGDRDGWQDYEARFAIDELGGRHVAPEAPRWDGGVPAGATILLEGEQGFGDTIQGLRFASVLAARGARVIVRVPSPLARLAAGTPGVSAVVAPDAMPACDAWAPMMSLPGLLRMHPQGLDAPRPPYLFADPARVDAVRARLAAARPKLAIGLAWAGNPRHANDRRRSCPLAAFAPLLARGDCIVHSLQHGDGEDQIAVTPAARALVLPPERGDFDGKAALIAALDLIVSVDTSVAHLAGALAAPVLVLLPRVPDWRWGDAGVSSGWYPSAHLVRQARAGDWDGVVRAVGAAIDRKASAR